MDKLKVSYVVMVVLVGIVAVRMATIGSLKAETQTKNGALYVSDYFPMVNEFPSAADADEGELVGDNLGKAYEFKNSSLHMGCKNYYCQPGSQHAVVTVFEILDLREQEKIVQAAKGIRRKFQTRGFSLEFYANETGPSPSDQFIRKVRID